MFLQTASHPCYIKTTTLPPIFRVSLATIVQPPPSQNSILSNLPQKSRNCAPLRSGPSDLAIRRPRCALALHLALLSSLLSLSPEAAARARGNRRPPPRRASR